MEVCHIIQSSKPPVTNRLPVSIEKPSQDGQGGNPASLGAQRESNIISSPNVALSPFGTSQKDESTVFEYSGGTTPIKGSIGSSGVITPVLIDQLQVSKDISWLVKLCVKNILPQKVPDTVFGSEDMHVEPLSVRLESLQTLANLTKGYFPVIR